MIVTVLNRYSEHVTKNVFVSCVSYVDVSIQRRFIRKKLNKKKTFLHRQVSTRHNKKKFLFKIDVF